MTRKDEEGGARSLLIRWANQQDNWLRALVFEVIETRKAITGERAAHFYDLFLREKELRPGPRPEVPALAADVATRGAGEPFVLTSVEDLRNVNALVPGQKIEFHPRLTVVFGENAVGKTGYVRVLKRAAAVRTAEEVLPNVHQPGSGGAAPRARLAYRLGGREQAVDWENQAGVFPFTRMDVFDARAAGLHVDEELTYVYTPGELALFPLVQQGIEQVQRLLEADIRGKATTANPFLTHFDRKASIYPKIEALGAASDLNELRRLAEVTEKEEAKATSLKAEIDALRSSTPEAHLRVATTERQILQGFQEILKTLGAFDHRAHAEALGRREEARRRYEQASAASFQGVAIPGVLGEEWRRLIEAGEAYLRAIHAGEQYPQHGEECIYCRQALGAEAVALVRKYRDYANSALKEALDAADRGLGQVTSGIGGLDIDGLERQLDEYERGKKERPPFVGPLRNTLPALRGLKSAIAAYQGYDGGEDLQASRQESLRAIEAEIGSINGIINDLRERTESRAQALRERESKLLDIESRKRLRGLLPEIEKHVVAAQWAEKGKAHARRLPGTLRSLTETAKAASDQLLNHDFGRRFEEECERLRAPRVRLEFPGRHGQVARRKAVAPGHRPSETLSEGEQKVIALADFLAEVRLKQPPAPVVFDDPITSLDYRRMSEVVGRIMELSEERQVIVFTHNIWFTTELLSYFEKRPADCAFYHVQSDGERIGIVSRGTHPRSDTVAALRGKINDLLQYARKATGEAQQALIEKGYEYLRSFCEVFVESELLQGVSQRYEPNMRMTKLAEIRFDRAKAAVEKIMPVHDRCCRYIASHSQPRETLNVRPTIADLEADWKTVQGARETYLKK